MAIEFHILKTIVYVGLFDKVDGYDLMRIHANEGFMDLVRTYAKVVYDYSDAVQINITEQEVRSFAKLAGIEAKLTNHFVIGIIPQNAQHKYMVELYQNIAVESGAKVLIIDELEQVLNSD
jgi:hypothetical protein